MTQTEQPHVVISRDESESILTLQLNRPDRANALSRSMLTMMRQAVENPAVTVAAIVLRGDTRVFSAGVDLREAKQAAEPGVESVQDALTRLVVAIETCPVPVVALVEAPCVGGAVELAMSCDMRMVTESATFRVPATEIGVVYRPEGFFNLSKRLSAPAVRQLLLLGLTLDAERALALGVADMLADPGAADGAVTALAQRLARVPGTFAAQKSVLRALAAASRPSAEVESAMNDVREAHAAMLRNAADGVIA